MIYRDLSYEAYETLPGWRWSHIKLLHDQSPIHVQHALQPHDDTSSRRRLRAVHAAVLEPDAFRQRYSVYDGVRRGKLYHSRQGAVVSWKAPYGYSYALLIDGVAVLAGHSCPDPAYAWRNIDRAKVYHGVWGF